MKFDTWFKKQFGRLPLTSSKQMSLRLQAGDLQAKLDDIHEKLSEDKVISAKYGAALYAWQCSDSYKDGRSP